MSDLRARLRIDGDAKGAVAAAQSTERALEGVGAKGRTAQGGLTNAAAGADRFERSATGARTAAMGLASAFAALGLRELAGHLSESAQQAQGFSTGLSAVAGGAQGAAAETAFLRKESERLGLVVQNQVEGFMSLAGATNGTVLAGEATREIWLGLVEAGTALNRSTEQQKRALEAVSQIASKGVVSMEEVRGQLAEAIPGATQIAARAMGLTSEAFIELVSSGDLLARDFLPRFAQQLRSEFGEAVQAQMITPLGLARREMAATKTALFDLSAAGGEGFLTGMTEGLAAFNAEIQDPETLAAARELGQTLGEAFGTAAEAAAFLVEHIEAVTFAAGALTTLTLARYLAGVTTEILRKTAAARAEAMATREAAAATVAQIQAEIRAVPALVASTTQTQRLAAAKAQLALASRNATPGMQGFNAAASGIVGLLGGPWGIAFTAAGGVVWWLMDRMAAAQKEGAAFEDRSLQIGLALAEAEAAGLDAAEALAKFGSESGKSVKPTEDLAFSLAGLGDKYAYVAAQAKNALVNQLLLRHADAQADVADLRKEAERTRSRSMGLLAASAGEAGLPADIVAEAKASMVEDPAVAALQAKIAQRQSEADKLAALAQEAIARDTASFAPPRPPADGGGGSAEDSKADRAAERRLERAREIAAQLKVETKLLEERSVAAAQGEAALEALAVKEAGLRVLMDLGVTSLGELSGAQREAAAAAVAAAEARERQAIATDKAQRVAGAVQDLDRRIAAERARTEAIEGGIKATLAWQKEEFVRQELERHGTTLTAEQIALLREKAEALYEERVVGDLAAANEERQRELNLARMTVREREIERRARDILLRQQIEMNGLTEEEAKIRARILAGRELEEEESAQAIGRLKEDLRAAFIESGEIGFDQIADYAERKLREAVYDSLLAEPIELIINAVVGEVSGLSQAIGGLKGADIGRLLGNTIAGQSVGSAIGQSMGLGSGNQNLDLGLSTAGSLAGGALAGTMAGGWIGAGVANAATALGASAALAGGLGTMMMSAAVLGPIGAIAGLALGSLFKDDKRPYARADIGVRDGQFAVTGGQELDDGPLSEMNTAAQAIVQSLNAAADLFKLDLTQFSGPTSIGYVQGKNTGRLGQGYFGGDGGGFNTGAQFSNYDDPEALAAEIVRATIIRAIEAGASDLSEAEKRVVLQAESLEEAATKIAAGRSIAESVEDAILQLTNPAEFERKQALAAIEASYQALKAQADELITAGLVSGDVLTKIDQLRDLQVEDALERLGEAADSASEALERAAGLRTSIEDRILELTNPQGFKVKRVEDEIAQMRAEAEALIAQGALSPDVLQQLELLRQLELANVFGELKSAADETAEAFARMAPRLQQWIDQLAVSDFAELSPQAERAEALRQYEEVYRAARMGDTDALGNLTAYADRLLSADREATLSAQDRLALVNRVRGEVGGLIDYTAPSSAAAPATIAGMGELQALLSQISANTALAVMNPANDDASAAAPVLVVNLPTLGQLYADTAGQQTDRHLAALVELRSAIVAVLDRHHGALTEDLKALRAAAEALPAVMDERLTATEGAMASLAFSVADLTTETRLGNAYLKTAVAR
ncbi:MAG: tape measure protein [Phenylobacterium sp.]|uniref:tape measure protein n=1 Tax=Phenylobacterium sp. TaxID=1871053 RepID=UPI0017A36D8C|nr:tape measure protein [Phenylobacterium sp.]MBA4792284.1 tape measure protein [Phenylobacterium sp.]